MTLDGRARVTSGLVTVVFVDVEGSTALVDRLGDDAGTAAVQTQLRAVRERLEAYEGREVKSLGDGVMLTFQSPRMAVSFALAAQRALGDSVPRVCIGINTGEVLDADSDPLGGAVNTAARIADKAKGGEVLVSEVVRQLLGSVPSIEFVDRGRTRLKGFPDRFHLYAAVDHVTRTLAPTTIGRAAELALVDEVLTAAETGRGQIVLLEGEAGIGKSHLLRAAVDLGRLRRMRVVEGTIDELEARPGAVVRSFLESIPGNHPSRSRLVELLAAPTIESQGRDLGYALIEATVDLVETMATGSPLMIVVEDLHWADELSLRTVAAIGRRAGPSAVVLLASCRPAPRPPLLDRFIELVAAQNGRHVRLAPLDPVAVCALAGVHTGAAPGDSLLSRLEAASGNPLYVTELLRALDDDGALRVEAGTAEVSGDGLPADLQHTIVQRLSWLTMNTVQLLRLGSLLGGSFTLRDLAAVSGQRVVDVAADLHEAVQASILTGDGDRLSFRHDVIREAIYEDMAPAMRRDLHRAAALALIVNDAPVIQVAQQFALGSRPGDLDAVEWLRRASTEAVAYDPRAAISMLEQAISLAPAAWPGRTALEVELIAPMSACGRSDEGEALARRLLATGLDAEAEFLALRGVASVHGNRGNLAAAVDACLIAADAAGAPPREAMVMRCIASQMAGLTGVATEVDDRILRDGLAFAEANGDHALACLAQQGMAARASISGYQDEGLLHIQAATEMMDSGLVPWQSYLTPHSFQALLLLDLDRTDDALTTLVTPRRWIDQFGAVANLPLALLGVAGTYFTVGRWDEAIAGIESGMAAAEEAGQSLFGLYNYAMLGRIALHRGDLSAADHWLEVGGAYLADSGSMVGADWFFGMQALVLEHRGQPDATLAIFETIWLQMASLRYMFGHRSHAAHTVRLAAAAKRHDLATEVTLALEEGARRSSAPSAAATALQCRGLLERDGDVLLDAAAAHRTTPFVPALAACCEQAGAVLVECGRRDDAVKVLEEAASVHVALGASGDLTRVDAFLRELGVRRRRPPARRATTGWESLTKMELQVADLVAEGLTNPAIGARLFISRRTVETHLSHIFTKCDLSSRAQVAAEVVRRSGGETSP